MTSLPLLNRDGETVGWTQVDDADLHLFTGRRLRFVAGKRYAGWGEGGRAAFRTVYVHRLIAGAGEGEEVDHVNRDRLDNRRANLRLVTHGENAQNHPGWANATSSHRGVYWHKASRKWAATVCIDGRAKHLGVYDDEEVAARVARDERALAMAGAVD